MNIKKEKNPIYNRHALYGQNKGDRILDQKIN